MNKKIFYINSITKFSDKQFRMFGVLTNNEEYVIQRVYNAIKNCVPGAADIFLMSSHPFKKWLADNAEDVLSRFDTYLIRFLELNKKYIDTIDSGLGIDDLTNLLIGSWSHKTKTLKANLSQLQMIYYAYTRFLHTARGQDFLYGRSIYDMTDDAVYNEGLYTYITPFFDTLAYREAQVRKCKKEVLIATSRNAIENCIVRNIWDETFTAPVFSYKHVLYKIRKELSDKALSDSSIYRSVKKLQVKMLTEILKHNRIEKYFDDTLVFSIKDKEYTIRSAIELWLAQAKYTLAIEKKQYKGISNVKLVEVVSNFCHKHGLEYSTQCTYTNGLIRIKSDAYFNSKKDYKLYFYKGGGFKCFRTGMSGHILSIIPQEYFAEG